MPCSRLSNARVASRARPSRLVALLFSAVLLAGCSDSPEAMLDSARTFLAENDINAASIQLKNALQEDGSLVEARFLLGSVYLEQGDIAGAVRELRRALDLGHAEVEVLPLLSRAMLLSGEFDRVIGEFAEVTVSDPVAQARILANVGDAYLARAEVDKSRQAFEAAYAANPKDVMVLVGLARSKLFAGEPDAALVDADAAIALDPDTAEAYALKADIYSSQGNFQEALTALENAVKAEPRAINYHFALVSLLLRQDRFEDAEQRLEQMKTVGAAHPSTLYLKAFVDFRKDLVAEARDSVEEVLRLVPGHLPAELLAGSVYLRLNDHVRAQAHLERVLARAPGQPLARRLLAASMLATGNTARAREIMEPLLTAEVDDSATLTLAGQIHLAGGDFERASDYFAKVSAASPEDVGARTRLGVARLAGGDSERAFADLEAASALDDEMGESDIALILAHLRAGDLDKAMAAQQQLERKQPENPQTHNLKGGILLAGQDLQGARTAFDRAMELDPDFISAAVNLARLDLAAGEVETAKRRFEGIIARNPSRPDPYLLLADLEAQTGAQPAAVRSTIERAIAANPAARAPKLALARNLLASNDAAGARTIAQELIVSEQDDAAALGILAQAQFATGDRQQAISSLNRLVRLQPQLPAPLLALADAQHATEDRDGAEQSLRRALALQPDLVDAQQRLISLLVDMQRSSDALAVSREVQQQRPDAAVGYMFEGDVHVAAGNWEQAIPAFESALERSITNDVAIRLHRAQIRAGKVADADKTAATWLEAQPDDIVMKTYLAENALAQNKLGDADTLYREIVAVQPDNALVLNNLAWVAGQLKHTDAIELAERALALAPNNSAILDTLGMLQMEQGEHDKGLANLRKAVDGAPNLGALRLNLARAYIRLERNADAVKELDEVLQQAAEGSRLHQEATRLKSTL